MITAVLGAGPHGRQIAALLYPAVLYDDHLDGYASLTEGARTHPWVIGAAWPQVRRQIAAQPFTRSPRDHGRVVFPGAQIGVDTEIGAHTHILFNAVVQHGCRIGEFVTICAGAVLSGEVTVGDEVLIGAGAVVKHGGLTIGDGAVVGAGAVVTSDVAPGEIVTGVPARALR